MKSTILIILISLFSLSCRAQIYNLNDKTVNSFKVPPGSYFKDIDGDYDKYLGLWKGTWDGKTLYLDLRKVKRKSDEIYFDEIFGERKIISANGTVEIDRISNFDYEHPEFRGLGNYGSYNGQLCETLSFYPKNMCNKIARLLITQIGDVLSGPLNNSTSTTKQMTLHFEYQPSYYDENCIHNAYVQQHDDFPLNFPKDIVLTKQ